MTPTLIAGLILVAGGAYLLWKGKAAAGIQLAQMFSSKKVLLVEFILFVLIFVHAHTAAELAVKAGWGYNQRFILHSFINLFSFVFSMSLYKNGQDVGAALKGQGNFFKELVEAFTLLFLSLGVQFLSLWMMCAGFKQPYTAFLMNKDFEYIGLVRTFASMYDFQLASSIVIILLETFSAIALVVLGSASAEVKAGTTKSGGMLSGLASMFGGMFKPTQPKSAVPKTDDLAKDICRIMGRPDTAITAVSRELDRSPNKRKVLSGLVSDFNTAAGFEKHNIKSQIQNVIEQ
jgi:hypothetical protein